MMHRNPLFIGMAALLLASCGRTASAPPTGQVLATVGGQEITSSLVKLETGDTGGNPALAANQQQAGLQAVIDRKLLANAARQRGLDKLPIASLIDQRVRELALIDLLRTSIVQRAPAVSDDEAAVYVRAHPVSFAQRQLINVDQLLAPNVPQKVIEAMRPIESFDEITALLETNKILYRRGSSVIDTASILPEAAQQISQLGVGKVFVTPQGAGAVISVIRATRSQGLNQADSVATAKAILTQQRSQGLLKQEIESILAAGKPTVQFNAAVKRAGPAAGGAPAGKTQ